MFDPCLGSCGGRFGSHVTSYTLGLTENRRLRVRFFGIFRVELIKDHTLDLHSARWGARVLRTARGTVLTRGCEASDSAQWCPCCPHTTYWAL